MIPGQLLKSNPFIWKDGEMEAQAGRVSRPKSPEVSVRTLDLLSPSYCSEARGHH